MTLAQASDLQALLDSPAVTDVTIPSGVWEVDPLVISRGNLTMRLAAGAWIRAKAGAFVTTDPVLRIRGANGPRPAAVRILGEGATSVLGFPEGEDYGSEHRHGVKITNCDDVILRGFRVQTTYGDGVYIGDEDEVNATLRCCSNVELLDLEIDGASRNGVAVTGVRGLRMRDVAITNVEPQNENVAQGGPGAGIDIEPNHSTQPLTGLDISRVTVAATSGPGINIELANAACSQDGYTADIAIDDVSIADVGDAGVRMVNNFVALVGKLLLTGVTVNGAGVAGLEVRDKALVGMALEVRRTVFRSVNLSAEQGDRNSAPIVFHKQTADLEYFRWRMQDGGAHLEQVEAENNSREALVTMVGRTDGPYYVSSVTGRVRGSGRIRTAVTQDIGLRRVVG